MPLTQAEAQELAALEAESQAGGGKPGYSPETESSMQQAEAMMKGGTTLPPLGLSRGIGGFLGSLAGMPAGTLGSMAGAGAGSAGEDYLRGEPIDKLKALLSMLLTGGPSAAAGVINIGSKLRPSWIGKAGDATRMGQAIEQSGSTIRPAGGPPTPGPEGLMDMAANGPKRLSAFIGADRDALRAELPQTGPSINPQARSQELLKELEVAYDKKWNAQGAARDSGAQAGRDPGEIYHEIIDLLNREAPGLVTDFKASQLAAHQGHGLLRALKPGEVLGANDFNQGEMQGVVNKGLKIGESYDPIVLKALFRGGVPPVGDRNFTLPFAPKVGMTYKAGPGANMQADPLMRLLGPLIQMLSRQGGP